MPPNAPSVNVTHDVTDVIKDIQATPSPFERVLYQNLRSVIVQVRIPTYTPRVGDPLAKNYDLTDLPEHQKVPIFL